MKEKPGSPHGLSFRQLASMNGKKKPAKTEAVPKLTVQKPPVKAVQSDEARRDLYKMATEYLGSVMASVRDDRQFSLEPGYVIMEKIVAIKTPMDALFLKAIHADESYDFVVNHSVNVAIYAVKMAETLGYSPERQIEMGMVGLFHDIGMAKIPSEIIYKKDKLNDREFHLIKERPKLGYEILRQFGDEYAYLAECTLQIYERIDGSGYPRGLKEDEIHEYAQMIGLVDMYEALIHTRPQREKILHYYAVKEIIRSGKRQFQQRYLKTLLNTFSIFPLHSYVKLNSNAIGRVIQTYQDQPMRPKLQIIYDSQRKRVLTERIINLPEHSLLYITDAVSEDELLEISEDSYLVTKPANYDGGHSSGKTEDTSADKKPSRDRAAKGKGDQAGEAVGETTSSSLSKVRLAILIFAAILLAAGIFWQLTASGISDVPTTSLRQSEPVAVAVGPTVQKGDVASDETRVITQPVLASTDGTRPAGALVEDPAGSTSKADVVQVDTAKDNVSSSGLPVTDTTAVSAAPSFETTTPPLPEYPYAIKLSHFRDRADAAEAAKGYRSPDFSTYWVKVDLGHQGIWYRVFGGYFGSLNTADQFIKFNGLDGAVAKNTKYANWVGSSDSEELVWEKAGEIEGLGFSPYVIQREDGNFHLYVGAFYTKAGGEAQYKDLIAKGIESKIVQR